MNLRQNEPKRTLHAPAKLNLFLEVLDRREDGYHELETLMVPVGLFDSLTFEPTRPSAGTAGSIDLTVRGNAAVADVPTDSRNLVVRALELLRQRSGCALGAKVELVKRIPSAAGLGGGSSDAAAALELGNRGWGIDWDSKRIAALAAEVGSDVPFFLARSAAICRGRGEDVEPIVTAAPLHVVIVKPPAALATADVYRALDELPDGASSDQTLRSAERVRSLSAAIRRGTVTGLRQWMTNRLQAAAAALSPWVACLRDVFAGFDCVGHQLTGSGSGYFGVCRHAQHARRLATILRTRQVGEVYIARSCR